MEFLFGFFCIFFFCFSCCCSFFFSFFCCCCCLRRSFLGCFLSFSFGFFPCYLSCFIFLIWCFKLYIFCSNSANFTFNIGNMFSKTFELSFLCFWLFFLFLLFIWSSFILVISLNFLCFDIVFLMLNLFDVFVLFLFWFFFFWCFFRMNFLTLLLNFLALLLMHTKWLIIKIISFSEFSMSFGWSGYNMSLFSIIFIISVGFRILSFFSNWFASVHNFLNLFDALVLFEIIVITEIFYSSWTVFIACICSNFTWLTRFFKLPSAFKFTVMSFSLLIHIFSEESSEFLLFLISKVCFFVFFALNDFLLEMLKFFLNFFDALFYQ